MTYQPLTGMTEPFINEDGVVRVNPAYIAALKVLVHVDFHRKEGTTTTVAVASLNGFTLAVEFSACVDARLFNEQTGKDIAERKVRATAENKLWELMGFQLAVDKGLLLGI